MTLWELQQHCEAWAKISSIGVQQKVAIKTLELLEWYDEAMTRIDELECLIGIAANPDIEELLRKLKTDANELTEVDEEDLPVIEETTPPI